MWGEVEDILDRLGHEGISSDETDGDTQPKRLRRVARGWLNPAVSEMWRDIEKYELSNPRSRRSQRGNRPLLRIFMSQTTNLQKPVKELPMNYYDSLWWKSLSEPEQAMLNPGPPEAIPKIVSPSSIRRTCLNPLTLTGLTKWKHDDEYDIIHIHASADACTAWLYLILSTLVE